MKYIYIAIVISIVFFYNIQAERCEIWWLKRECYSKPCSCCSSEKGYFSMVCSECCKKNGNRFCVRDIHYHRCETANTTSDRPYTTQTPLNKTDQYSSNSNSKHSLGAGVYFAFAIMAASILFLFTTIVNESRRCRRKLLRHERRNVPYTSANVQTSSNDGRVQHNPIYNIGGNCKTTIPADLPPVYSIGNYNCAQYVTNYEVQNDPPPVYTNGSFNCAQNVDNGDVQNDSSPVDTNGSFNCVQNVTNGILQNDQPPGYTIGRYNCAQNVTNDDLQNDPPPVYTNGSYNCAQNVTNSDLQNDPPPVYSIGRYSCTINVTNR
ncbi:Hypothetical predicted protein [Mytilus galloprovincialis]|uniref:TNFR-Cys domain-containing protein n=1 Tax=Mytilus galloprovincialis TaxID=29158 RepID=A0A8B6H4S1_MYTGA|nr:Hypothetical predicted protein [Mytilus galloprovincialis]